MKFIPWKLRTFSSAKNVADVTVILTVWKRNYFQEQLKALLAQTVLPAHIWVYQCGNYVNIKKYLKQSSAVDHFHYTRDLKYFGRFSLALHVPTAYTWVLDDDVIPSPVWIETCIKTSQQHNAIVCSNGRIIPPNDYAPEVPKSSDYLQQYFIGDSRDLTGVNLCAEDTLVDYGCSSYFFKTDWIKHFWAIPPYTLTTGEDMHLAATFKVSDGIATVVPKQTLAYNSGNVKPAYSCDDHASWKKFGFIDSRAEVLNYLINEQKWRPLLWDGSNNQDSEQTSQQQHFTADLAESKIN